MSSGQSMIDAAGETVTTLDHTTTTDVVASTTNSLTCNLPPPLPTPPTITSAMVATDSMNDYYAEMERQMHETGLRMIAAARGRHLTAGFSEATAPTEVPKSFQSPLWEAIKLARTDPDESNRRVRALVGQPYFIEDDEWVALCERGCAAGLRILRDHGFRPTAGSGIKESCRRSFGTSTEACLEILRPLLEVTNSFGSDFARASAEMFGESACQIARQTCASNGLPNDHELIRLITTWCKEQTGKDW